MSRKKEVEKRQEKQSKLYIYIYIAIFAIVLLVSYFFPYTHDDWAWGTSIGEDRLNSLFANYNGRWVGNLLVMLLTRNRIVRAIVISLSFVALVYLIQKLVKSSKMIILSAIILLLAMPISVLAQAVAWTSGFANYVIPIIIVLFYLSFNKNIFTNNDIEIKNRWVVPFLMLGFINSLFVEHATLYNVLLSIGIVIYYFIRKHKIVLANIFYMIGSILGAILMFSNEAYQTIFHAEDGYRTIEQDNIIIRFLRTFVNELADFILYQNVFLNIVLCLLSLFLVFRFYKKNKQKAQRWKYNILNMATFVVIGFLSYILYKKVIGGSNVFIHNKYKLYLEAIIAIAFAISLVIIVFITIEDECKKKRILFEIASIVILAAPLLVVTPIGPRCFFPTYALFVLVVCELLDAVVEKESVYFNNVLCMISLCFCSFLLCIYGYCFKVEMERIRYIQKHNSDMELLLPKIPFQRYMQCPNPGNEVFVHRFKLFYGLDDSTELEFVDYKEWKKNRKK